MLLATKYTSVLEKRKVTVSRQRLGKAPSNRGRNAPYNLESSLESVVFSFDPDHGLTQTSMEQDPCVNFKSTCLQ